MVTMQNLFMLYQEAVFDQYMVRGFMVAAESLYCLCAHGKREEIQTPSEMVKIIKT